MNIINGKMKKIPFSEMKPGEVFLHEGVFYLCAWRWRKNTNCEKERFGVELLGGQDIGFTDDEMVFVVKATLIIDD